MARHLQLIAMRWRRIGAIAPFVIFIINISRRQTAIEGGDGEPESGEKRSGGEQAWRVNVAKRISSIA